MKIKLSSNYKDTLKLFTFCLILLSLSPAHALEVGDIKLMSQLGEPLNAELRLSNMGQFSHNQIIVQVGDIIAYQQFKLERSQLQFGLKFSVSPDGTVFISSREPINEPFLNFIIECKWPEGKLYKEIKLLIDPD